MVPETLKEVYEPQWSKRKIDFSDSVFRSFRRRLADRFFSKKGPVSVLQFPVFSLLTPFSATATGNEIRIFPPRTVLAWRTG